MIKAFHVFCGDPTDGSLLVFAETANRARVKAIKDGPYEWEFEYIHTRARRVPMWDKYVDRECIIEFNDELPEGAPSFYRGEWDEG